MWILEKNLHPWHCLSNHVKIMTAISDPFFFMLLLEQSFLVLLYGNASSERQGCTCAKFLSHIQSPGNPQASLFFTSIELSYECCEQTVTLQQLAKELQYDFFFFFGQYCTTQFGSQLENSISSPFCFIVSANSFRALDKRASPHWQLTPSGVRQ